MDGAHPDRGGRTDGGGRMDGVTVTRIGTQVVVRLSGAIDDERAERLTAALDEVSELALRRVVVDLSDTTCVRGAGLDFLAAARTRWQLRLLDPPDGLVVP